MCDQHVHRKLCANCDGAYIRYLGSFISCPLRIRGQPCGPVKFVYWDITAGTNGGLGGMCGRCAMALQAEARRSVNS